MSTPQLTPEEIGLYDQNLKPTIIALLVVFLAISNSFVPVRIYSQLSLAKKLFAEDYYIIGATVFADVINISYLVGTHNGMGLHIWRVAAENPYNVVLIFQSIWLSALFAGPVFLCLRLSLLYFYRRIFLVNQTWLRIFWWTTFVYNILWFIGTTVFYVVQCLPPSYFWTRFYARYGLTAFATTGNCDEETTLNVAIPLMFGLVSDFALLCMPIFSLSKLLMTTKRKLGLIVLFSFGLLACFLELARILIMCLDTDGSIDPTYYTVTFAILTCCVQSVAIACACVPFIYGLVRTHMERTQSSRYRSSSGWSELSNRPSEKESKFHRGSDMQALVSSYGQTASGTVTTVRASSEREGSPQSTEDRQIRVKTDLELQII